MAHFPQLQPTYHHGGYMQAPMPPSFQNNPGFPRGFPAARYAPSAVHAPPPQVHVTPEMMRFGLQNEGYDQWPAAPTDDEATESESDSDESTKLEFPQAYYSERNTSRGRSNSLSAARHYVHRRSASIPREQTMGFGAQPHAVPMDWHPPQQHATTPFFAPQDLPLHPSTPFHSNLPLPLAPQTQPLSHHQQQMPARHQAGPQYGAPVRRHTQMHHMYNQHPQQFPQMPPMQYPPVHSSGSGIHSSVPQPAVIPMQKVRRKSWVRSKSKDRSSLRGILQWSEEASIQAIVDPRRISGKDLSRIELHPLLAPGSCRDLLVFNMIRLPAALRVPGNHTIEDFFSNPATSPPMNQLTIWTGVHEVPIDIQNQAGVTVGNVIRYLGDMMFRRVRHATWNAFSEGRRQEVSDFFDRNRLVGLMPPREKGVLFSDLLCENTIFCGMQLWQQHPNGSPVEPGTFRVRWASS